MLLESLESFHARIDAHKTAFFSLITIYFYEKYVIMLLIPIFCLNSRLFSSNKTLPFFTVLLPFFSNKVTKDFSLLLLLLLLPSTSFKAS